MFVHVSVCFVLIHFPYLITDYYSPSLALSPVWTQQQWFCLWCGGGLVRQVCGLVKQDWWHQESQSCLQKVSGVM